MRLFLSTVLVLAVYVGVTAYAEQQPSLAGSWTLDGFMGPAPLGFRDQRAICPLPASGASTGDSARPSGPSSLADDAEKEEQLTPLGTLEADVTISQTPTEITVERRYAGSAGTGSHKDVFKLDGTESVSTVGKVTSRTRSRWEGAALVVEHHLTWGPSEGSNCHVRETLSLDSGGALSIVATNERQGHSSSRQTYVRKGR